MNPKKIRNNILSHLFSSINSDNGYYEKLGIQDKIDSLFGNPNKDNLFALDNLQKKFDMADELIEKYRLEGNDLNNEIAFKELKTKIDLIFKPKGIFSFFK